MRPASSGVAATRTLPAAGSSAGAAVSLADAAAQVVPVLDPPKPDLSKSPFAALQGFKA